MTDITDGSARTRRFRSGRSNWNAGRLQLSRLASDLTLAEQHAREELAKTLHDGLQQLLVIASLNLDQQATRDKARGIEQNELLGQANDHLDEAIAAARSLSVDLFPPVLQHARDARRADLAGELDAAEYGLAVNVTVDPLADSPRKDVRTLLFESVRELLFNAVKHAQTDRVSLGLGLTAMTGSASP